MNTVDYITIAFIIVLVTWGILVIAKAKQPVKVTAT